jgi:molecular chaperone GrpE (heat shock protein)
MPAPELDDLDRELLNASPDTAEEEYEESAEEEEPEDISLTELRDEITAATMENRRNTKRVFEVLKQFGGLLDAMSGTVNDLHENARSAVTAPVNAASAEGGSMSRQQALGLIEMEDRLSRLHLAFNRQPAPATSWLPAARAALAAWEAAWKTQKDALDILLMHFQGQLKLAGLERQPVLGQIFDPATMNAVETAEDATVADHTVLAELLPGWRRAAGGEVLRPAQVRVSRMPKKAGL